jgi:hypothetical protein
MCILAIDPGNVESAYVLLNKDFVPTEFGKISNEVLLLNIPFYSIGANFMAIEMVASYGMSVGVEVFETVFWIGRFWEAASKFSRTKIYRKDVKMNLCHSMKAKDSNITQALIDRFAYGQPNMGKGTKKNPGWFHGFSKDIWQAYAVGVTYHDLYLNINI